MIQLNAGLPDLTDAMAEARRFLALPEPEHISTAYCRPRAPTGSSDAARRLFAAGRPIVGTRAEAYLRARGLALLRNVTALRFHPRCFHRSDAPSLQAWPALLAAVTDLSGRITGVHRTWLDRTQPSLAPLPDPRRSMGELSGHAVRFGQSRRVLVAGEGLETVLSVRSALPTVPHAAALSAAHLGALLLPPGLRRLYIARDQDAAGDRAAERLRERAEAQGVQVLDLVPERNDFNDDLRADRAAMMARLHPQLAVPERARLAEV